MNVYFIPHNSESNIPIDSYGSWQSDAISFLFFYVFQKIRRHLYIKTSAFAQFVECYPNRLVTLHKSVW